MSDVRRLLERWGVAAAALLLAILTVTGALGAHGSDARTAPRTSAAVPTAPALIPPRAAKPEIVPKDQVALGAYIPNATKRPAIIESYARSTGRPPAILVYYRSWLKGPVFDDLTLRRMTSSGAIPMVTWEPWKQPLSAIAAGKYDRYIRTTARAARRWGQPLLLRFAHEMNGNWYPWGVGSTPPRAYVAAWRHIVGVFRREHASNVRFVWAPNAEHDSQATILRLYPGDRWVDWVALSGFNWGGPWLWESAWHVFRNSYLALTRRTKKPLMIAETSAGEAGGDKPKWIERTFTKDLRRMPRVRAVVWFNGQLNWAKWDADSSPASLKAFRTAVGVPHYGAGPALIQQLSKKGVAGR